MTFPAGGGALTVAMKKKKRGVCEYKPVSSKTRERLDGEIYPSFHPHFASLFRRAVTLCTRNVAVDRWPWVAGRCPSCVGVWYVEPFAFSFSFFR